MNTKEFGKIGKAEKGLMQKTVASFVTVFFIFSGIPVPTSFAAAAPVTTDETQQVVPVVTLEQANAKTPVLAAPPLPSGSAIQNTNPLSAPTLAPVQTQAASPSVPAVPQGWTRAASNANYAFKIELNTYFYRPDQNYFQKLKVMNLVTGKEEQVYFGQTASIEGVDVSPDGLALLYSVSKTIYMNNTDYQTRIHRLVNSDPSVTNPPLVLEGKIKSVNYLADHLAELTTVQGGSETEYLVDLNSLTKFNKVAEEEGYSVLQNGYVYYLDVAGKKILVEGRSPLHVDTLAETKRVGDVLYFKWLYSSQSGYSNTIYQSYNIKSDVWTNITEEDYTQAGWPSVPTGWTQVPSMPTLAYQITSGVVRVMDLVTGSISDKPSSQNVSTTVSLRKGLQYVITPAGLRELYEEDNRSNKSLAVYNPVDQTWIVPSYAVPGLTAVTVSPDGQYAVVTHQLNRITVVSLAGARTEASVLAPAAGGYGIPYVGAIVFQTDRRALVKMNDGSGREFELNILANGTIQLYPAVPTGWTRAASNPNFAFMVDGATGRYEQAIFVMDLRTGSSQMVAVRVGYRSPGYSSQDVDVSPDGKYVYYKVIPTSGAQKVIEVYGLVEKKVTGFVLVDHSYYTISKIAFVGSELWVSVVPNRTSDKPAGVYVLNLKDGSKRFVPDVPSGWTRAASNANFAFTEVVQRVGSNFEYTLKLMDLRTGKIQDVATRMNPYGGYTNVYDVSPDGSTVIYGKSGSLYPPPVPYTICLQRISEPSKKLVLNGELKSVSYDATGSVATLVLADGSRRWVDLKTLTELPPPVPEGWTRAASNANFAFRVKMSGVQQILVVKDLLTGKNTVIVRAPVSFKIGSKFDISPDGTTVAYTLKHRSENRGVTVVQSMSHPAKRVQMTGVASSMRFVAGEWVLVINARTVKVNPQTLRKSR